VPVLELINPENVPVLELINPEYVPVLELINPEYVPPVRLVANVPALNVWTDPVVVLSVATVPVVLLNVPMVPLVQESVPIVPELMLNAHSGLIVASAIKALSFVFVTVSFAPKLVPAVKFGIFSPSCSYF
jgi:hypothetical protein